MPKLRPATKEMEAQRLANLYNEKGSQVAIAKTEGVTRSAISQRFATLGVNEKLHMQFEKEAKKCGFHKKSAIAYAVKKLGINGEEGMAKKTVSAIITGKDAGAADHDFVDVPDEQAQHKWFETLCKLVGWDVSNKGVVVNQGENGRVVFQDIDFEKDKKTPLVDLIRDTNDRLSAQFRRKSALS